MKKVIFVLTLFALCASAFAALASAETNIFLIADETPSVQLSSFTAAVVSDAYIAISWITQSETGLIGFNVYRAESPDLSVAILLSDSPIPATNTSSTQMYCYQDGEVGLYIHYYYWLEVVDYQGSTIYGPISIYMSSTDIPPLPEVSSLKCIYPNPFGHGGEVNIEVIVNKDDWATVSIYNLAGQSIKSITLSDGSHLLNWDGKNLQGHFCSSGIYFVRLRTNSVNQTKKLMLIK